jgi:hypothetical protein
MHNNGNNSDKTSNLEVTFLAIGTLQSSAMGAQVVR